jgi:uncharacterized protein YkwD
MAVAATVLMLASTAAAATSAAMTRTESSLLTAMNEARRTHGLRPLRSDWRLERVARHHSSIMLRSGRFFHGAFNARIRRAGVRTPRVGENLAWGAGPLTAAQAIVNMWLASPEHRANLLRPGYRLVGVGALRGTFSGNAGALMITTDFAGR